MRSGDDYGQNLFSHVLLVNLNVLCTLMKSGIDGDEDNSLIITMHGDKRENAVVECTILRIKQNLYSTLRN